MTFGRPSPEQQRARRAQERARNLALLIVPARTLHTAVIGGSVSGHAIEKEVKAKPGKRAPTTAEREWMANIVAYGCVACRMDGFGVVPPAVHHILRGGRRIGHLFTLPLCDPGHHQGGSSRGMVSRHPWKARFEQRYGSEDFLLRKLQAEIGGKK